MNQGRTRIPALVIVITLVGLGVVGYVVSTKGKAGPDKAVAAAIRTRHRSDSRPWTQTATA